MDGVLSRRGGEYVRRDERSAYRSSARVTERVTGRVFVTRRIPRPGLALLQEVGAAVSVGQSEDEQGLDRDALLAAVRESDVLVSLLTERIDREVLEANPA